MDIKIGIVDDHLIFLESISMLIESIEGFQLVMTASSGAEILERLTNNTIDVLLCDLEMPVLNGLDTTLRVKSEFSGVKVIWLTMYTDPETIQQGMAAGVSGILSKKISKTELVSAVRSVMNSQIYFSEDLSLSGQDGSDIELLTPREKEVLRLLASGMSYKMIASTFDISYFTVNTHIKKNFKKLKVNSGTEAITKAIKYHLIPSRE
jgi:DNA-binding NarL/FixJ family response regulator